MSEIFAAQITAVANVVLAVFAIVTAVLAGLAFCKQSGEVSDQAEILRRAAADREREAAERRRAQALEVYDYREGHSPEYDLDPYVISARASARHRQHVNGKVLLARPEIMRHPDATDLTAALRAAQTGPALSSQDTVNG